MKYGKYSGNMAVRSFQILYIFVFLPRKWYLFPRLIQTHTNLCKLHRAIFSVFHNISQPNFAVLLILRCPLYSDIGLSNTSLTEVGINATF